MFHPQEELTEVQEEDFNKAKKDTDECVSIFFYFIGNSFPIK